MQAHSTTLHQKTPDGDTSRGQKKPLRTAPAGGARRSEVDARRRVRMMPFEVRIQVTGLCPSRGGIREFPYGCTSRRIAVNEEASRSRVAPEPDMDTPAKIPIIVSADARGVWG